MNIRRLVGTLAACAAVVLCVNVAAAIGPRMMVRFTAQPATTTQFLTGTGQPLTISADQWSAASGEADVYDNGTTSDRVVLYFSQLVPGGYYSVFDRSADGTLAPLDGTGSHISFTASQSGTGYIEVQTAHKLGGGDQIALVYHGDGHDYGALPGPAAQTHLVAQLR